MKKTPILEMWDVRKEFPGVVALDRVNFDLLPGEVHALVGENGAGKSTLIKIISGIYQRDAGSMKLFQEEISFETPMQAVEAGIKTVYQELDLVSSLSVAENVFLGDYPRTPLGLINWKQLHSDTDKLIAGLGANIDPRTPTGFLRVSEQQLVEIARSLSREARIIIMDEPTSALSPDEAQNLFETIEKLKRTNVAIIYISHKLDEVFQIADRVTVLRDGQHISTASIEATYPEEVVAQMVGQELKDYYPKTQVEKGAVRFQVSEMSSGNIDEINLSIDSGEVVGLFGLLGAGHHEVGRAIFGDIDRTGEVKVDGKLIKPGSPVKAIQGGLGLLTENRREDGLVPLMGVKANLTMAYLKMLSALGWISQKQEKDSARTYVEKLSIKTPSLEQPIRFLSGGNQQKVLMARWMLRTPKVLVLSEPTRGIDVGAKTEIYRLINNMAQQGLSLLVISTEMQEVIGICDRIVVMFDGQIINEFSREEATEENLLAAATGIRNGAEKTR